MNIQGTRVSFCTDKFYAWKRVRTNCRPPIHEGGQVWALNKVIDTDEVLYDVGANMGYYSVIFGRLCDAEVHAFEPHPRTYELLKKNLGINGIHGRANPYAVSIDEGETRLSLGRPWGSPVAQLADDGTVSVETISVDEYAKRHVPPTVLKIDVEGHGIEVLKGAEKILGNNPTLLIECHKGTKCESPLLSNLADRYDYGYKMHREWGYSPPRSIERFDGGEGGGYVMLTTKKTILEDLA